MNPKLFVWLFTAFLFALVHLAQAQQPAKVARIGYLSRTGDSKNPGRQVEGFRQALRDLGYIEGKNILVEYRYIAGKTDSIPSLVAELVELKVDVLVLGPYHRSVQPSRRPRRSLLSW